MSGNVNVSIIYKWVLHTNGIYIYYTRHLILVLVALYSDMEYIHLICYGFRKDILYMYRVRDGKLVTHILEYSFRLAFV